MKLQEWRPVNIRKDADGNGFATKEEAAQYLHDLVMRSDTNEIFGVQLGKSNYLVCLTCNGLHSEANGLLIGNLPGAYQILVDFHAMLKVARPPRDNSDLMSINVTPHSRDVLLSNIEDLLALAEGSSLLEPSDPPDANV